MHCIVFKLVAFLLIQSCSHDYHNIFILVLVFVHVGWLLKHHAYHGMQADEMNCDILYTFNIPDS